MLKINNTHNMLGLIQRDIGTIKAIHFRENNPTLWETSNGSIQAACIGCTDPKCMFFSQEEIGGKDTNSIFPIDTANNVCPTKAIHWDANATIPHINADSCILCGICASRCPLGAIYLTSSSAKIASSNQSVAFIERSYESEYQQLRDIEKYSNIRKEGIMIQDSDSLIISIYDKIRELDSIHQFHNILTRNLLIATGNRTYIRRKGDVYFRIDALTEIANNTGVIEIEFQNDVMGSPRSLLEDIAVLSSRYNYKKETLNPYVISLEFPNARSEYWMVINDISNVLKIKIQSLTIAALMLFVWHLSVVNLAKVDFYADNNNPSIRKTVARIINFKTGITSNYIGALEAKK